MPGEQQRPNQINQPYAQGPSPHMQMSGQLGQSAQPLPTAQQIYQEQAMQQQIAWQHQQQPSHPQSQPQTVQISAPPVVPVVDAKDVASSLGPDSKKKPKQKRSSRLLWKAVLLVALIVLVGALGTAAYIAYTYWNGQHEYDELMQYMTVEDSETVTTLASFDVDWDALREINPDVVGWIYLPDSVINYPVVRREGDDDYYMKHNFGQNSVGDFGAEYGAIGLASDNSPEWTDQASYLSGHHMANGTMFAMLATFVDSGEFNAHRTFYLLTPEGNFKLTSFACNKVHGKSDDIIIPNFGTRAEFSEYLQNKLDTSLVEPDPPAPSADEIEQVIMMYTCNEPDNRFRICVYTTVDEFLPAGSNVALGNALIGQPDLEAVGAMLAERLK